MSCNYHQDISAATSLLCAFFLCCVIACLNTIWSALGSLFVGACFFFSNPDRTSQPLVAINVFILFIWLIVPWTTPGETIYRLGILQISKQGCLLCLLATFKANAIILVFMGIMNGMNAMKLGLAFAQIHLSSRLALMIVFSAQQIDILKFEWKTLKEAANLKGFQPRFSLHSWKTIASMLAILLVRASEKAELLHEALLLRSFSGKFPVCCKFILGKRDFLLIFATLFAAAFVISLNFYS